MLRTVVVTLLVLLFAALVSFKSHKAPQVLLTSKDMASAALKFLTVAPRAKHTATVIFIHVCVANVTPGSYVAS